MAPPPGWILGVPVPSRFSPVQNCLNAPPHPRGRFGFRGPNWLQYRDDVADAHIRHRHTADGRINVFLNSRCPWAFMDWVFSSGLVVLDVANRAVPERQPMRRSGTTVRGHSFRNRVEAPCKDRSSVASKV